MRRFGLFEHLIPPSRVAKRERVVEHQESSPADERAEGKGEGEEGSGRRKAERYDTRALNPDSVR